MPDTISRYASPTEGTLEVAKLMSNAGISVNMHYGCDESWTYGSYIPSALVNAFGYPSGISYVSFEPNTVIGELKYGNRPVIMTGIDPAYGGHAWVCDGYARTIYSVIHNPDTYYEYKTYIFTAPYFNMNWGWDGSSNGWYVYPGFTPGDYNFDSRTMCVINIHP